jgi:hypothetical protein
MSMIVMIVAMLALILSMSDVVYHIARKYQTRSKIAWIMAHETAVRLGIVGAIGFIVWSVMLATLVESKVTRTYTHHPVLPKVSNVVICYTNGYASTNILDVQKIQEWTSYAIWYEARGENVKGRQAVASVLWNRAGGNPGNILGVLQNTNWLGRPELLDPSKADRNCPIYKESWLLAGKLIAGEFKPIGRWTHFYNPTLAKPSWGPQLIAKKKIGEHMFGVLP